MHVASEKVKIAMLIARNHITTCPNDDRLDLCIPVVTRLNDVGAAKERVALVILRVEDLAGLRGRQGCLRHRHTLTCK